VDGAGRRAAGFAGVSVAAAVAQVQPLRAVPTGTTPFDDGHAAAELLRRRRARTSLAHYARSIDIPGAPVDEKDPEAEAFRTIETAVVLHHRVIMEAVQWAMETGGRLMIQAPPGSAKSTYVDVVASTWAMGRWPGHRIILGSYASDIAAKQSRKARAVVRQLAYQSLWAERPVLPSDQRAVDQWGLTNGSELMAAGLLAGITGNRANGVLIDDPISNREAADSPTIREKIYNEFIDTALTRLLPGGYVIIINTRWHEDDLCGRILPENYAGESGDILCRDGQVWRVLNIPAKAEHPDDPLGRQPGEYLWPEWFTPKHWAQWENNPRAARTWSALFQQRPSPESGLQFQRADARWYDPDRPDLPPPGTPGFGETVFNPAGPPKVLRLYGASDYATKDESEGQSDFTEHGVAGMDHLANLLLVDWWTGQRRTDVSIAAFTSLVQQYRQHKLSAHPMVRWWNEGGVIDRAIRPAVDRAMREALPLGTGYVPIETLVKIADKAMKALSFHARYCAHTVWFPVPRPGRMWPIAVLDQLVGFPTAKHDDKVDVLGLLGRGIDAMLEAAVPSVDERKAGIVPFTAEWLEWEPPKADKVRYFS
jgi:hypothetical protein